MELCTTSNGKQAPTILTRSPFRDTEWSASSSHSGMCLAHRRGAH
jgi:hypothetical protein